MDLSDLDLETAPRTDALANMARQLEDLNDFDIELVERTDLGEAFSVDSAYNQLRRLKRLLASIDPKRCHVLSVSGITAIANACSTLKVTAEKIIQFDVTVDKPLAQLKRLIDPAEALYDQHLQQLTPHLALLRASEDRASDQTRQYEELVRQLEDDVASAAKYKNELSKIVDASRASASVVGASAHASIFASEAGKHRDASWDWLIVSGVALFLTFFAASFFLDMALDGDGQMSTSKSIQVVAARLTLMLGAGAMTGWCATNYKSSRHNETLNKHRAAAMQTFEAFAEAGSGDSKTKDAILLQAASAAFSPRLTGYENSKAAPQQMSAPLSLRVPVAPE